MDRDRVGGRGKACGWGRIVGPDRERERENARALTGVVGLVGAGGLRDRVCGGDLARREGGEKRAEGRRSRVEGCLTLRLPPLGSRHAGPKD